MKKYTGTFFEVIGKDNSYKLADRLNTFEEEEEDSYFREHRKVVKSRLETLGYQVTYCRVRDNGGYCTNTYHNRYVIMW